MPPRSIGRVVYITIAVAAVAFTAGLVVAAAAGISPVFTTQNANENVATTSTISWLTLGTPALELVPSPAPAAASSSVGTPTLLSSGSSLGIGAVSAWGEAESFSLAYANAPASTEMEWQLWVNSTNVSTLTIYLETPSTAASGSVTFYYELAPAGGTFTLNQVTSVVQQCASVGSCP